MHVPCVCGLLRRVSHVSLKVRVPTGSAPSKLPTSLSYRLRQSSISGLRPSPSAFTAPCHSRGESSLPARPQSSAVASPSVSTCHAHRRTGSQAHTGVEE